MRTLILYYTYSGNTRKIAAGLAATESADIAEIKDLKRPGKLKAYVAGSFAAMKGKAWPIQPLDANLADYDRLILMAPIWAGHPAPAFYSAVGLLPEGKAVVLKMVSASGKSSCQERLEAMVQEKGCQAEGFEDVKSR
jgi:menaquinone-dependent protoporphyrinogen IX oxidase